jgi:hypothetical protein
LAPKDAIIFFALLAQPVRHVYEDFVAEVRAEAGERYAGVAAGGFGNCAAGGQVSSFVRAFQNAQRHSVLHRAAEVVVFQLEMQNALFAFSEAVPYFDHRGAAYQLSHFVEFFLRRRVHVSPARPNARRAHARGRAV